MLGATLAQFANVSQSRTFNSYSYTNDSFFHISHAHKPSITVLFDYLFGRFFLFFYDTVLFFDCVAKNCLLKIRFVRVCSKCKTAAFFIPFVSFFDIWATNKKHLSPDDLWSVNFKLLCFLSLSLTWSISVRLFSFWTAQ